MVKSLPPAHRTRRVSARTPRILAHAKLAGLFTAVALAAAACGSSGTPSTSSNTSSSAATLNTAPIARAIEQSILKQRGIHTVVNCPASVPQVASHRFTCATKFDVGTYTVGVLELNAKGGVSYSNSQPLRLLAAQTVETAIQNAIKHQRHLTSTVTCPAHILEATGLKFTCTAKLKHGTTVFAITETNNRGGVRFVGR